MDGKKSPAMLLQECVEDTKSVKEANSSYPNTPHEFNLTTTYLLWSHLGCLVPL